jgi:uncharacterized membrane protein
MRTILEFIKTTVIGGLLVLLPIYLSVLLLLKAFGAVAALVAPLVGHLSPTLPYHKIIAVLLIIVVCFACGILMRTALGAVLKSALERKVLEKIPGYELIRGLTGRVAGRGEGFTFAVVLVEIEEALVPAFFIEDCDEQRCAVFVPSVPTPAAGAIYIIDKARVHPVDIPFARAVSVISKWGSGSRELLEGMQRAQGKAVAHGVPQ